MTATTTPGTSVEAVVAAYRPKACPEPAAAFARRVVAAAQPASAARARSLLWACARLGAFGAGVGLETVPEVLLHPSVIERFVAVGLADAPMAQRRTVRTNLRFLARVAGPGPARGPDPLTLPRSRAKAPYTPAEIDAYLGLAGAQPSEARRMRLSALVCLGAGAGLRGADMRHLRGSHVGCRHGGVVAVVEGGRSPRVVPVLARYHRPLLAAAAFAGEDYLIGGVAAGRRNVTNRLVASVAGGGDLAPLEVPRLRASWLAACAAALGLPALFAAAGISQSQHVGDIVGRLPACSEAEAVALLGGLG
jgi:integrase